MAKKVLKNVEIWYTKVNKPSSYKGGPAKWELQMRTTDQAQADDWEERGFTVKPLKKDKKTVKDEKGNTVYRANISRKVLKGDGSQREPVVVVDGNMDPVDPRTIGNGSVANIQYTPWSLERDGEEISGRILEKIQLIKHVVYTPRDPENSEDEELPMLETEVIEGDDDSDDEDEDSVY
jgi:hypothetical protein